MREGQLTPAECVVAKLDRAATLAGIAACCALPFYFAIWFAVCRLGWL